MALFVPKMFKNPVSLLLLFYVGLAAGDESVARRILFAKCDDAEDYTAKPTAVFMTCTNPSGVCDVNAGGSHTLRAVFEPRAVRGNRRTVCGLLLATFLKEEKPEIPSRDVDSYVRWNSWVEVPLPGQIRDACGNSMECPAEVKSVVKFTYDLGIQSLWPRGEYPVIWSLSDRETGRDIVCFKFRINIV